MRILFTHLFMFSLFTFLSAQTGSVRLGKQITNGSTDGGCATNCVTNVSESDPTFICNPYGTGNSVETMTHDLTVPAGYYMELTVVTNACDASTDGLDDGDNFYVNGVLIVQGNMNTRVNYSGCFVNNTTSITGHIDLDKTIENLENFSINYIKADFNPELKLKFKQATGNVAQKLFRHEEISKLVV